jgi:hypothetical protein
MQPVVERLIGTGELALLGRPAFAVLG